MAEHDHDEGNMTGRSRNDQWVDEELRAALAVEPSPDFTARVRTRIDREQVREARRSWIFATSMLAASAVLAITASVAWRANPPLDPNVLPSVTEAGLLNTSPLDAPAAGSPGLTIEPRVTTTPVRFASPRFREPEVLMPRDERLGIQRLIEFTRSQDNVSVGLMTSMSGTPASEPVAQETDMSPQAGAARPVATAETRPIASGDDPSAGGVDESSQDAGALVIKPLTIKPLDNGTY